MTDSVAWNHGRRSTASGRERRRYYVCTGFHNKGRAICANGLPLPMPEADDAVLVQLREYVLRPDIIEGAIHDAVELLRPQAATIEAQRATLTRQLTVLGEETGRLTAAVASGGELASLLAALKDRERQREAITQQIAGLDGLAQVSSLDVRRIERDLRGRVTEWRAQLRRQAPIARQIVTKLLDGRLVFTPPEDRSWTCLVSHSRTVRACSGPRSAAESPCIHMMAPSARRTFGAREVVADRITTSPIATRITAAV